MINKITIATLLVASVLCAEDANALKTHAELGYISTGGNTDTQTFNTDAYIKKHWDKHGLKWSFDGQYAVDTDVQSKNKFFTELLYDYKLSEHFTFDYLTGYKRDRFSAYDYQFYTGPGATYTPIKTKKYTLSLGGNILFSRDTKIDDKYDANGNLVPYPYTKAPVVSSVSYDPKDYTSVRAKGVFIWQMLENLKFNQELTYRVDTEDSNAYFVFSKSELSSKFSDIFSGALSYKVDYVNQPGDKERTDTTFTLGLIVDY